MKLPFFLLTMTCALARGGEWVNISDAVTSGLKPGYAGPTAGVAVDRKDGGVYMVVNDLGLWRSADHGAAFAQCSGKDVGGRGETGWALQADPAGKRLACFMVYGNCAMTVDGGVTWSKWTTSHFDFGSVDWTDTGRRLLALRHESGGVLTTSGDAGATWTDLQKGFSGCGVIDKSTFLATKEKEAGIFRSTDAGATWTQVHAEAPWAAVPVVYGGAVWWATGHGILVSRDKGATWQLAGMPVEASYGPLFDTTEHFTVAGKGGFFETRDGGRTWEKAAPLPDGFVVHRTGPFYTWDPAADIFYASAMTKPAMRFSRR